jgi:ADP-ribose pyrophosphatase YjhB (NUDIX family)
MACPACGRQVKVYMNPFPTVDIIIDLEGRGVVLIQRKNPPLGWALPGGFIDYGESAEEAAVREAREETGLEVKLQGLVGVYSDPKRDPRLHALSVVFKAEASGEPHAQDDAIAIDVFKPEQMPQSMAFDHKKILEDYFRQVSYKPTTTTACGM